MKEQKILLIIISMILFSATAHAAPLTNNTTNNATIKSYVVAIFSGFPTSGKTPLHIHFTDNSTGSPNVWKWDFGDGSYSYRQNPEHTYYLKRDTAEKYYTVSLTASQKENNITIISNTNTKPDYIRIVRCSCLL